MTTHLVKAFKGGTVELRPVAPDGGGTAPAGSATPMRLVFNADQPGANTENGAATSGAGTHASSKYQLFEQQDGTVVLSTMEAATETEHSAVETERSSRDAVRRLQLL